MCIGVWVEYVGDYELCVWEFFVQYVYEWD